ncbi:MAG: hypothetical protein ACM3ZC_02650 [Bacteroidota bacterium]
MKSKEDGAEGRSGLTSFAIIIVIRPGVLNIPMPGRHKVEAAMDG